MAWPTFKKHADIPEGFRDEYEEKDGEWVPKLPEADDGAELKTTLEKERKARKDAEKERKAAEEARADLERKLAAATGGGDEKEKAKLEKALAKFDADLAAAKAAHQAELDKVNGELRKLKLTDKVTEQFLKAGGRPERAEQMRRLTDGRLDLEGDRIVVKDAKGEVTSQSVEDFFAKTYKTEVPEFYSGTRAAGGGAGGGAGGKGAGTGGKMSPDEIIANPLRALQEANANGE